MFAARQNAFFVILLTWTSTSILFGQVKQAPQVEQAVRVESSQPNNQADNVALDASIHLRFSDAIDPGSLNAIRLTRLGPEGKRVPIAIQASTDLTNASVTVSTVETLLASSQYELTSSDELKDANGNLVAKIRIRFQTGSESNQSHSTFAPKAFDQTRSMTTVLFGPDRRLYAASAFGELVCWTVDEQGRPKEKTQLFQDKSTSMQFIDLEWDPDAKADNLVLWLSYAQRLYDKHDKENRRQYFTGEVAKWEIRGDQIVSQQVVLTGLPHGRERQGGFDTLPHQPNGLCFKDGLLYQSVGSTSSNGGPPNWGIIEQPLSACVLEIDYQKISAPLDVSPLNEEFDPTAKDSPVRRYATGVRNALEIVAHSNGNLYTAVNINDRNSRKDGVPDSPDLPGNQTDLILQRTPDHESLLLLRKNKHYGFPNPAIGNYIFAGGNPTSGPDPFEITDYPVGTQPAPGFAPELMYPIWKWGGTSPNGMIEYLPDFPHDLRGQLLCCFYSANDIAILDLGTNGMPKRISKLRSAKGKLQFRGPLDITQDRKTGSLYICDFGKQSLFGEDGSMIWLRPEN